MSEITIEIQTEGNGSILETISQCIGELEKLRLLQTLVTLISHGFIVTRPIPEPITVCPYCDQSKPDITTRRINTLYHDDESNWITSCLDCYKETIAHYNEMWSDYYAGCM